MFIHLQHFTTFHIISCFLFVFKWQTSQVVVVAVTAAAIAFLSFSDSEFYESFGKWNPMVAFLMWLPHGNFHIVLCMHSHDLPFAVYSKTHIYDEDVPGVYIETILFIHCLCICGAAAASASASACIRNIK